MSTLKTLSRDQLLTRLHDLIQQGHALEARIIAHLGEVDARQLYLEQACPSMFHYCVHVLHLAEGVTYKRISVARAARKFPELLVALEKGDVHLTAASLIAPHLNRECAGQWIAAARHKTIREIKRWIVDLEPKADVATSVRRAPTPRWTPEAETTWTPEPSGPAPAGTAMQPEAAPSTTPLREAPKPPQRAHARCEPLGAAPYCIRFTTDETVHRELQELQALLRHQIPDGDVAKILGRAVRVLLEQVRKQKTGACSSPRTQQTPAKVSSQTSPDAPSKSPSRTIPAAIRRAVWARDEGRCTFESREGRQCGSRDFLELHHQVPWACCREHSLSNIHLRCRAHNQLAAELDFGTQQMAAFRRRGAALDVAGSDAECVSNPVARSVLNPVEGGAVISHDHETTSPLDFLRS